MLSYARVRVYFSTRMVVCVKMKTGRNLRVKNNGDG